MENPNLLAFFIFLLLLIIIFWPYQVLVFITIFSFHGFFGVGRMKGECIHWSGGTLCTPSLRGTCEGAPEGGGVLGSHLEGAQRAPGGLFSLFLPA